MDDILLFTCWGVVTLCVVYALFSASSHGDLPIIIILLWCVLVVMIVILLIPGAILPREFFY